VGELSKLIVVIELQRGDLVEGAELMIFLILEVHIYSWIHNMKELLGMGIELQHC
jgi:hypothetical protein